MVHGSSLHYYRARWVMPIAAPILEDGAVIVCDGKILAVGKNKELRKKYTGAFFHDLGEVILMPGLINAHCHLDYTMMRGKLTAANGFAAWIAQLNQLKFSLHEKDFLKAIAEGCAELRAWGCTTICNIESFPELLTKLPELPGRICHFFEVMDIRGATQGAEGLISAENFFKKKADLHTRTTFGISPHAPQTSSQALYRSAASLAQQYHLPFCTHLAESEEEFEMFTQGAGALFDFLKSIGRTMSDCGFQTPVQALLHNELLPRGALLVHMNFLNQKDRELLALRGADFFVIHCPKTHRFFKRPPFDWKFFQQHGYRLLLGTDSLASNETLNLFEEMQAFAMTAPALAPEEILKMVTLHPAAAIGMAGRLGALCAGAEPDFMAIPFAGKAHDLFEVVIENRMKPAVF